MSIGEEALHRTVSPGLTSGSPPLPRRSVSRAAEGVTGVSNGVDRDVDMIRAAARITRDLGGAKPGVYWTDLIASSLIGYAALLTACVATYPGLKIVAGLIAVLALYRAVSFIHELTHLKPATLPGFRTAWNVMVGVPLMAPSFMYEGVHVLHHARTRYGTDEDPEYLPLARLSLAKLGLFVIVSALAPAVLILRFAILGPLSVLIPPLRRWIVACGSALSINPAFRRKPPQGAFRRSWRLWEIATSAWALLLIASVAAGVVPLAGFLTFLAVTSGITVINQFRTLAAHLWDNDGGAISISAQYLDSVNIPPPGFLPVLWAPVGLRYHALHHLLPALPYHALGEAHRRLAASLPAESAYHRAHHKGMGVLIGRLVAASARSAKASSGSAPAPVS